MSIINIAPELVLTAAGDLSRIGSTIEAASATAASAITGVVPPAADEVSAQLATLFTGHAQSYQAAGAQAAAYHEEFAGSFAAAGARYALAEVVNSSPLQTLEHALIGGAEGFVGHGGPVRTAGSAFTGAGHGPAGGLGSTLLAPGNALIRPTAGLGALKGGLPHQLGSLLNQARFPILHQILQNQFGYFKRLVGALATLNPVKIWDAIKSIAHDLGHNAKAMWDEVFNDVTSFVDGDLHLPPLIALTLDLMDAPMETMANVLQYLGTLETLASGHRLAALVGLTILPEIAAYDFLFGHYAFDAPVNYNGGQAYVHWTAGGLLTGVDTVWGGVDGMPVEIPLTGTPLGGLLGGMRYEAQQIANAIAPATPKGLPSLIAPPEAPPELPRLVRPLDPGALGSLPPAPQP
jgi:PE family protein